MINSSVDEVKAPAIHSVIKGGTIVNLCHCLLTNIYFKYLKVLDAAVET